ncbi:MAG TPA: hypothetical protein VJ870_13020 [Amycolatopsis sp.]|nr:hypothetical protein [Amycolatopsis sp.]
MDRKDELCTGTRVTYAVRSAGEMTRLCRRGTVTGAPIFDRYTSQVWVPVQPDGTSEDIEPSLIRKDSIIDIAASS